MDLYDASARIPPRIFAIHFCCYSWNSNPTFDYTICAVSIRRCTNECCPLWYLLHRYLAMMTVFRNFPLSMDIFGVLHSVSRWVTVSDVLHYYTGRWRFSWLRSNNPDNVIYRTLDAPMRADERTHCSYRKALHCPQKLCPFCPVNLPNRVYNWMLVWLYSQLAWWTIVDVVVVFVDLNVVRKRKINIELDFDLSFCVVQ